MRSSVISIGGGRSGIPRLLFVTDTVKLSARIGGAETELLQVGITASGHIFCDTAVVGGNVSQTIQYVRDQIELLNEQGKRPTVEGIVILGGYDVIPPKKVSITTAQLHQLQEIYYTRADVDEGDELFAWSDDPYSGRPNDRTTFSPLPVSRIPDCCDANYINNALMVGQTSAQGTWFGLRNINRPYADAIFRSASGSVMETSAPRASGGYLPLVSADNCYLVLHGAASPGTTLYGESSVTRATRIAAIDASDMGNLRGAVVFTGVCYGALTVTQSARDYHKTRLPFVQRTPLDSFALYCISAGANAFIGTTSEHISPSDKVPDVYAGPLHQAFWLHVAKNGMRPSQALHLAKRHYSRYIPNLTRYKPSDLNIQGQAQWKAELLVNQLLERKLLAAYSCIGLGW